LFAQRFPVEGQIAAGGMGTIFRAIDRIERRFNVVVAA